MPAIQQILNRLLCHVECVNLILPFNMLKVQFQKKIHTHPKGGHRKFLGGGGS